jgi:hypothetical protein
LWDERPTAGAAPGTLPGMNSSGGRGLRRALVSVVTALLLAGCGGQQAQVTLPEGFPEDFPVPSDASGGPVGPVLTLEVPRSAEIVHEYYREALTEAGWTVTDGWEGKDPHGRPSTGFMVERGEAGGAVAITESARGKALVQANFDQPENTVPLGGDPGPGAGAGAGSGTAAPSPADAP